MQKVKEQPVLRKDDYEVMLACLRGEAGKGTFDRHNAEELEAELKKAKLVSKKNFPANIVRLNSKVKIKDDVDNKVMELTLVTPEKADIKERRISVMAPIGTALIGFKEGQKVTWQVPSGNKTFIIMEVDNTEE